MIKKVKAGDRISYEGVEHVVATLKDRIVKEQPQNFVALVSLEDGNRWSDPVWISKNRKGKYLFSDILKDEFDWYKYDWVRVKE